MGIVWISMPAHDQANRFRAVASLRHLGTVFCVCHRLPEIMFSPWADNYRGHDMDYSAGPRKQVDFAANRTRRWNGDCQGCRLKLVAGSD